MKKYNKKYLFLLIFAFITSVTIISNACYAQGNIPTPPTRPNILNVSPSYIEELKNRGKAQSSGEQNNGNNFVEHKNEPAERNETTLISFTLKPEQIILDANLEGFLKKRAINLLHTNKKLKMEIHAYATPIKNEPHSDIRISLARALEIRSFLINNNVSPNRLKLSPMGSDDSNNSDDRIDLIFIETN